MALPTLFRSGLPSSAEIGPGGGVSGKELKETTGQLHSLSGGQADYSSLGEAVSPFALDIAEDPVPCGLGPFLCRFLVGWTKLASLRYRRSVAWTALSAAVFAGTPTTSLPSTPLCAGVIEHRRLWRCSAAVMMAFAKACPGPRLSVAALLIAAVESVKTE